MDRDKIRKKVIEDFRRKFCQWTDYEVEEEIDKRLKEEKNRKEVKQGD